MSEDARLPLVDEAAIARAALRLGAADFGGPLSEGELALIAGATTRAELIPPIDLTPEELRAALTSGCDPLGEALASARSAAHRRSLGAIYTPRQFVDLMTRWVAQERPLRIVDAGTGSARFLIALALREPNAQLLGIDLDPLACLIARANLGTLGARSYRVIHGDFLASDLAHVDGRTAFISNPPYLRHHSLGGKTKAWGQQVARELNVPISGLAGLHAYFFAAVALRAKPGDIGCFITSSEWLDVNYGEAIRRLFVGRLGGVALDVLAPTAEPFEGTITTAAVASFKVGAVEPHDKQRSAPVSVSYVRSLSELKALSRGRPIARQRLSESRRWSPIVRADIQRPSGFIELGELCRVHRGAVTGANSIWVTDARRQDVPVEYLQPSVTRARELFEATPTLSRTEHLRRVIDLPDDLDELPIEARPAVERFLAQARAAGAADGYVARNRRAWWSVGLREAAPILATYMARRAPAFVRNAAWARHINIAHGIYPRIPLPEEALDRLAAALRSSVEIGFGRTYAGGLTKFEPREMERLPIPDLKDLLAVPS